MPRREKRERLDENCKADEHARNALSYLVNQPLSFDILRLVRHELGQAYFISKRHTNSGPRQYGHKIEEVELFRTLFILVNSAINNATYRPIPVIVQELKNYFSSKKQTPDGFILNEDKK